MNIENLNEKIVDCFCKEFQSVWIIDANDLSMCIFKADENASIPDSIETVINFNSYAKARLWYIDNCIVESDRKRLTEQTALENICANIMFGEPYYIEYSRISGNTINYNQLFYAMLDGDKGKVNHFALGFRDIDVRKKAERDDLTGLYTRQVFFQKAEALLKKNKNVQYDLMISDIVDFKEINETYGANVGDDVLRWVGSYLAPSISEEVLVGRYGGDQFVVLARHEFMQLINSDSSSASFIKAEKNNNLPDTVVKFGIYENVEHDKSILSICDKAHIALNSIKHSYSKMYAQYDDKLKRELEVNRKIEGSMHQAIEDEQFKVYYQPKHDALTGKLVGAEALVRWIHPEYGFMSPGDFIPLFEKNGFVVETDYYVWKRTCKNLRRWQSKGIKTVPISVNASKLTFAQPELLRDLQKVVDENNVSPEYLHLEITETMMTDDIDSLVKKMTAVRAIGYQIELDDFGSGYSSLNILSALPLDVVKLDMSFMREFGDPKRAKVLAACIKLAKDLGYKTVSEGVELKEQCELLSILGVDAIQGYYYSKPLPEDEFEEYMIKNI